MTFSSVTMILLLEALILASKEFIKLLNGNNISQGNIRMYIITSTLVINVKLLNGTLTFRKSQLHPIPCDGLFERWHLDFLGKETSDSSSFQYVLFVSDSFSN